MTVGPTGTMQRVEGLQGSAFDSTPAPRPAALGHNGTKRWSDCRVKGTHRDYASTDFRARRYACRIVSVSSGSRTSRAFATSPDWLSNSVTTSGDSR